MMSHETCVTSGVILGLFAGWFLRWLTDLLLERRWIDRLTRRLPCPTAPDPAPASAGRVVLDDLDPSMFVDDY